MTENGDLDDVLNAMTTKSGKKKKKQNRLRGLRVYLAGPIDHAKDDGIGWRDSLKPYLRRRGMKPLDPCAKPISYATYGEVGDEKEKMMELKKMGRFFDLSSTLYAPYPITNMPIPNNPLLRASLKPLPKPILILFLL